jgi:hypothetical protein
LLGYNPVVEYSDYYLWSEYAIDNIDWINDDNIATGSPRVNVSTVSPFIYTMKMYNRTDGSEISPPADANKCASTESFDVATGQVDQRPAFEDQDDGPFLPVWQSVPIPPPEYINIIMLRDTTYKQTLRVIRNTRKTNIFDMCSSSRPFWKDEWK